MEFNYSKALAGTANVEAANDEENEYRLIIDIASLTLTDESIRKVQIILLCDSLVSKIDMCRNGRVKSDGDEDDDDDDGAQEEMEGNGGNFSAQQETITLHSTPTNLAKKLAELSVILTILPENRAALGNPMMIKPNECFANSVKCKNFAKESLTKAFKIAACEECELGEITIVLTVIIDTANSARFRPFYVQSTAEQQKTH